MSTFPLPEKLTDEQSETLDKAALLVISARKDAAAMLRRAGLGDDDDFFGSRCRKCFSCPEYDGEGRFCERSSCRHSAAQHAS